MMNSEYSKYLLTMALLLATFVAAYMIRRKRAVSHKNARPKVVKGGNVSIFFDKGGNVTIVPYVKDKYGSGKATANVVFLRTPFTEARLGSLVKRSMNGSILDTPCTNKELLDILGVSDWNQFSEEKRNISLYFREGYGLIFNTTTRKSDGAYQFNHNGVEHMLFADSDDGAIGRTILRLLSKCR